MAGDALMAPSAADLHAAILDRLKGTTVTVYDGDVPGSPPADAQGRVYPYVVVWGTPGHPAAERPLTGAPAGLVWSPQVTVVAGAGGDTETEWLLKAVGVVRGRLEGARLTPDRVVLRERDDTDVTVKKDPDAKPVRFFLPLYFTALT